MRDSLQHPLETSSPVAADRLFRLWDAIGELERRRDRANGCARDTYDEALQLLYRAWSKA